MAAIASMARRPSRARSNRTSCVGKVELLEVGAERGRRDARGPQIGDGRGPGTLRQLLAVVAGQETVVDHLGELTSERPRDTTLGRLVRSVIGPAEHVRDPEREVVGDSG